MTLNEQNSAMAGASGGAARRRPPEPPVRLVRPGNEDITIGENSVLEGSFDTRGAMFVDGAAINADLNAGFLSIGTCGRVEGQARVERAEIAGVFDGTLVASGEVTLRASARVDGDIKCARIVTHRGAVIAAQIRIVETEAASGDGVAAALAGLQAAQGPMRRSIRRRIKRAMPLVWGAALAFGLIGVRSIF
ncbi:polymer-forming cytoskeletal protein [Parvibaculum sp.]|uniref:bactofilin family protein n=1 Tax=Parvibaculum sp. TaxID=2024848 RepID=UPI001D77E54F|nr:polymer-forming cytoskeletal protein [Parvibaculum sp.]MBX3489170.1 polymer-forming cytoskeletal protein [Parvibaculum sp.]